MTAELTGLCRDHTFESAEDMCRRCGTEFCELCLVFPFGAAKPYCKECAMAAGGVRSHVGRPAMGRRDLKKKLKAFEERKAKLENRTELNDDLPIMDPILADPLAPTDDDLQRVAAAPVVDDGAEFAGELAASFQDVPPPPPAPAAPVVTPAAPAPQGEAPADGVAPPIDWNQPFG